MWRGEAHVCAMGGGEAHVCARGGGEAHVCVCVCVYGGVRLVCVCVRGCSRLIFILSDRSYRNHDLCLVGEVWSL